MQFDPNKPMLTLTDKAAHHVKRLMGKAESDAIGWCVGIKQLVVLVCNIMEFATDKKPFEDLLKSMGSRYLSILRR